MTTTFRHKGRAREVFSVGPAASGGGGGGGNWPPSGDVLGFDGPVTGSQGSDYAIVNDVDLLDNDWTFWFDVTCTVGINAELLSQWASNDQSIRIRLGAGVNFQSIYSTTGTDIQSMITANGFGTLNVRTGLCRIERALNLVTLYDSAEQVVATADIGETTTLFDAAGPMTLGSNFIGTIHQAALVIGAGI